MAVGAGLTAAGAAAYSQAEVDLKFKLASATGPIVRLFDAETSHNLGIMAAKWGFFPKDPRPDPPSLKTTVWGRTFNNPLGARPLGRAQAWGSARGRPWSRPQHAEFA